MLHTGNWTLNSLVSVYTGLTITLIQSIICFIQPIYMINEEMNSSYMLYSAYILVWIALFGVHRVAKKGVLLCQCELGKCVQVVVKLFFRTTYTNQCYVSWTQQSQGHMAACVSVCTNPLNTAFLHSLAAHYIAHSFPSMATSTSIFHLAPTAPKLTVGGPVFFWLMLQRRIRGNVLVLFFGKPSVMKTRIRYNWERYYICFNNLIHKSDHGPTSKCVNGSLVTWSVLVVVRGL